MDMLRMVMANRMAAGMGPPPARNPKTKTKAQRAAEQTPGTKSMRKFIIAELPGKKVVVEHLEAIISRATESSDEEED